jgi:hypothetical protein
MMRADRVPSLWEWLLLWVCLKLLFRKRRPPPHHLKLRH